MKKIWKLIHSERLSKELIFDKNISEKYKLHPVISSILNSRGIKTSSQLSEFLYSNLYDLDSPFLFRDMEKAVERINKALKNHERIIIYGDRDVDGITGTSVLYSLFRFLKSDIDYYKLNGDEGYGLSKDIIDKIKGKYSLLITVDCGISNFEEIRYANENNLDVIITDHHEQVGKLPEAIAVIDPKTEGETYPFKELSGVGVAYKLSIGILYSKLLIYCQEYVIFSAIQKNETYIEISLLKARNGRILYFLSKNIQNRDELLDILKNNFINENDKTIFISYAGKDFWDKIIKISKENNLKELKNRFFDIFELSYKSFFRLKKSGELDRLVKRHNSNILSSNKERQTVCNVLNIFEYIKIRAKERLKKYTAFSDEALPLTALGTIADIVPLHHENRVIVKLGMQKIATIKNLGINAIFNQDYFMDLHHISSKDIGWSIAPMLNAPGKFGKAPLSFELLISEDSKKVAENILKIIKLNQRRKELSKKNLRTVESIIEKDYDPNDKLIFIIISNMEHGVTGQIANKLIEKYYKPIFIIIEEDGEYIGAARSIPEFDLISALKGCEDLLSQFGGHKMAAGITVKPDKLEEFRTKIKEIAREKLRDKDLIPTLEIDAEINLNELNKKFFDSYILLEPFGKDNPAPLFITKNIAIENIYYIGKEKEHLKIEIKLSKGNIYAWAWFLNTNENKLNQGDIIDIVYRIEFNYFKGELIPKLIIEDLKKIKKY